MFLLKFERDWSGSWSQQYWTVLSDLVHGEVIGLARDRTQEILAGLVKENLDNRQRASVEAVCIDMHQPYVNAFAEVLPKAEVVYDKFHVLQHAAARHLFSLRLARR